MKEAAQPVAKKIRAGMPKEFRRLIKTKLIKAERRINGNRIIAGAVITSDSPMRISLTMPSAGGNR